MGLFDSQKSPWNPIVEIPTGSKDTFNNLQKISMGAGSSRFEANIKDGLWMGADTFATAPFSVDFLGNLLASSVTIKNENGDILIDSNSSTQDYVQIINSKLNTDSQEILADFDFGTADYAGAVKSGDIAWNTTTGAIVSGSGVVLYRGGIVGANAGVATFTINAVTGDATFAGTLSAPSGTLGTITAGTISGTTITGSIFQTDSVAGLTLRILNTQYIQWYDDDDQIASIRVLPGTDDLTITADGGVYVSATGSGDFVSLQAGTGGLSGTSNGVISFNAASNFNITCDDYFVYYNDDNDNSDCSWISNITERMRLDQSGNLVVGGDINSLGKIQCGDTFESSDGTDGVNSTSKDFVTTIRYDDGAIEYKTRDFTFKDGLLVDMGSESDWIRT